MKIQKALLSDLLPTFYEFSFNEYNEAMQKYAFLLEQFGQMSLAGSSVYETFA